MQRYVVIVNEKQGVSATDPLHRGGRTSVYALAETAQLVGVRCIPGGFVPRIPAKLPVFEKFAGGRIKNRERRETVPVFQGQCYTEKCKSVNLRWLHVKSFAETRKGQWLLSWLGGFGSRDVVLDLFVIKPPRDEQRKWCLGTGTCAMGYRFVNGEQCRRGVGNGWLLAGGLTNGTLGIG